MIDQDKDAEAELQRLLDFACTQARRAGELLREGFGTAFDIDIKPGAGRHNLVTEYDQAAEKLIVDALREEFPEHAVLAEEGGEMLADDPEAVRWIIDPLDGTVNFAHGIPLFSVSIAAQKKGEILCGAVYQPMLDELFHAAKGTGAFLNGKGIKVSGAANLPDALLVTGFPYNVHENPGGTLEHFTAVLRQGIPLRRLGSAALDLCYVAAGRFDGFFEIELQPWDVAAGYLIAREAGATTTNYAGAGYRVERGPIVATNGHIHAALLDLLQQAG